ncbi:hypothetical protein TNCV_1827771 [Trichonephila clavipes]|nr:hypothetical protein TNCV_1827771 [Trichonephila clavipes]
MLHRTDKRWRIRRETSESQHPATIVRPVQARALWSGECFPGILWVLLWLSINQNLLLPFWIAETGHHKDERNVRFDLTSRWVESY